MISSNNEWVDRGLEIISYQVCTSVSRLVQVRLEVLQVLEGRGINMLPALMFVMFSFVI